MKAATPTVELAGGIRNSPSSTSSQECRRLSLETMALQGAGVLVIVLFLKTPVSELIHGLLYPQAKVFIMAFCAGLLLGWVRAECLFLGLLSANDTLEPELVEHLGVIGGCLLLVFSFITFILASSYHWSDLNRGAQALFAVTATVVYSEIVFLMGATITLIYFAWGFNSSTPFG